MPTATDNWANLLFSFKPSDVILQDWEQNGTDFLDAQKLWDESERVEIPARTEDEPRFIFIGKITQKYWSAIITYRENKIRIISVRRSRKEEIAIYKSNRIW